MSYHGFGIRFIFLARINWGRSFTQNYRKRRRSYKNTWISLFWRIWCYCDLLTSFWSSLMVVRVSLLNYFLFSAAFCCERSNLVHKFCPISTDFYLSSTILISFHAFLFFCCLAKHLQISKCPGLQLNPNGTKLFILDFLPYFVPRN